MDVEEVAADVDGLTSFWLTPLEAPALLEEEVGRLRRKITKSN